MSKEAMKLALGKIKSARDCHPNAVNTLLFEAEEILEEALEKPDFWEGYVPEPVKPAQQEFVSPGGGYVPAIPAQQALDKKAENARELGLDYEPAQQEPVAKDNSNYRFDPPGLDPLYTPPQPAQQEPWPEEPAGHKAGGVQLSGTSKSKAITELYALFGAPHNADINLTGLNMLLDALIASPPPQRTWVGLVWGELPEDGHDHDFLRGAVWAEAKLKEKNT